MLQRRVLVMIVIIGFAHLADARTRRHHRNAFQVALQPFEMVHAVVHPAAAPILAVATEPVRVAYYAARPPRAEVVPEPVEDDYSGDSRSIPPALDAEPEVENSGAHPTVRGDRAVMRNGVAYAPSNAPQAVKNAIWAVNTIRNRPYVWGGGHGSFYDYGYDCSGTVSFALHNAGAIGAPLPSSDLMRFGERGRGRWFTIYSRPGHTFAVIAGLRLDTTDFQRGGNVGPRWHADMRDTNAYIARHPYKL